VIYWSLLEREAGAIYFAPASSLDRKQKSRSNSSVLSCPAVLASRQRTYVVCCPFDLRLRLVGNLDKPAVHIIDKGTSIAPDKLKGMFTLMPNVDWINPSVPVFQIATPYIFFSEQKTYLTQRHPYGLIGKDLPHRVVEGRFPISSWKRPLSWACEWVRTENDFIMKRGEPWFDITFETNDAAKPVKLENYAMTEQLSKEILKNSEVTGYVRGTFTLFGQEDGK